MNTFCKINGLAKALLFFVFATGFAAGNIALAAGEVDSGACGKNNNLIWTLTDDGIFTIEGSGEMEDYLQEHTTPWYQYREDIVTIVFPDGLTHIGEYAFCESPNLNAPIIPNSVTTIGKWAFKSSSLFGELVIPDNVATIENCAFWGGNFTKLTFGSSVTKLRDKSFAECENLTTIISRVATPPTIVTTYPVETFTGTDNVEVVYVCGSDVAFSYKASDWGRKFGSSKIINDCTQVSGIEENILGNGIIYPNPVSSSFTVDYEGAGKVAVFDMSGKEILTQTVNGKTDVAVHHLPAGVYMVRLYANAKAIGSAKIIKK